MLISQMQEVYYGNLKQSQALELQTLYRPKLSEIR